jgi:NAD(P)H dehydrogenase (quinone)
MSPSPRSRISSGPDGIAFGTPTRFGNVSTSFTSSQTVHGGHESTILALNNTLYHWGVIVVPLGYTVHEALNGGGNPYGASFTSDHIVGGPDEQARVVARAQGARLARVARVIRDARNAGLLPPGSTALN